MNTSVPRFLLSDPAVQLTVTGGTPPWIVGGPKLTKTGPSSGDCMVTGDGHAMTGPAGSGAVGEWPHAVSQSVAVITRRPRCAVPDLGGAPARLDGGPVKAIHGEGYAASFIGVRGDSAWVLIAGATGPARIDWSPGWSAADTRQWPRSQWYSASRDAK